MFRVSVMYPNQGQARFDLNYYRTKHMELVKKLLKPFGLIKTEVDKGISGGSGQSPPYICVGQLYFESEDGYDRGVAQVGSVLRGDIPNFTDVKPIRQISEILD
ncbi:MAG TPA: EthD family reductase [Thermodesulfobacteriota bacterium]|nr:EthD family reductase [Thermodesulfobacteriota bacterium]